MELSNLNFVNDIEEGAKELITRYHETGNTDGFDIIEAKSAHGIIYRVVGYPYVIKEYKQQAESYQERFIISQLEDCPYSPRLYAYVENKFIVLEYIEGLTIQQYLQEFYTLPQGFYDDLRDALYEIAWVANFILGDMKIESTVIINRETGSIKLIDYVVGDTVDFPDEVVLYMAHKNYLQFLSLMKESNLFNTNQEAKELLLDALYKQEERDVDYFIATNCRDILSVFERRKLHNMG
ncbi:hypothetical protein EHV15_34845 [Paenibacillus oralis]|uniref:Serine/threonine protein kinase n=1 Tax=Paenibacillus oralis TaxID=2490856 RepID=A0A3P3T9Q6_9BACL|nr:hypothetical protein [Paenibacillus oralis]RRJ54771.1 hypothetical protein EHV15_34845 [Paenibacillus oralis]